MNKEFQPAVNTGTYGDFSAKDEQFWAATELYLLTKEGTFLADAQSTVPGDFRVPHGAMSRGGPPSHNGKWL